MKRWSNLTVIVALSSSLAQDAQADLVAYYPFNGSGNEVTGNNIDLNLVGDAAIVAGSVTAGLGSSLRLGDNGGGAIGQNFVKITTNNLTGVAWVNAQSLEGDWNSIVKNWGQTLTGQFHFGLGSTTADMLQNIAAGASNVASPGDMPTDDWVHVGFVLDSSALQHRLYMNGQLVATAAYSGTLGLGGATGLGVGHKPNDNGSALATGNAAGPWIGFIDEVGLYNEALSALQIQQIYQNGLAGIPLVTPPSGRKHVILPSLGEGAGNNDVTENGTNPPGTPANGPAVVTIGFNLLGNPVTPQPGTPGEDVGNLVDDLVFYDGPLPNLAKWNDAQGDTIMLPVHVRLSQPRTVRYYTLTSANDEPNRDPWHWRLLGTNVANPTSMNDFTVLDQRTEVEFSDRDQTHLFAFTNDVAYRTYRFEFETELVAGGPLPGAPNSIQLAEVELFENMTFTGATLTVDRATGSITMTNAGTTNLPLLGYSITSPQGRLNSDAWLSIAENYDGDDSAELDVDTWIRLTVPGASNDLGEVENPNGNGGASLAPGQSINLGDAWIASPVEDLLGHILVADGTRLSLAVDYIGNILTGDYNADGSVNAADFVVWRVLLGTNTQLTNEGLGITPGIVTIEDYNAWRANFGNSVGTGSSAEFHLPVPEPAGWVLALFVPGLLLETRRGRRICDRCRPFC